MDEFMEAAAEEARRGLAEGGIPIGGCVLVLDGEFSAAATTVVFKKEVLCCMPKWTA